MWKVIYLEAERNNVCCQIIANKPINLCYSWGKWNQTNKCTASINVCVNVVKDSIYIKIKISTFLNFNHISFQYVFVAFSRSCPWCKIQYTPLCEWGEKVIQSSLSPLHIKYCVVYCNTICLAQMKPRTLKNVSHTIWKKNSSSFIWKFQ